MAKVILAGGSSFALLNPSLFDLPMMTTAELFQAHGELHEWIVSNMSLRLANR